MFRLWSNNTRYIFFSHLWLKIVPDFRCSDCFPSLHFIAIFSLHSMFPAPLLKANSSGGTKGMHGYRTRCPLFLMTGTGHEAGATAPEQRGESIPDLLIYTIKGWRHHVPSLCSCSHAHICALQVQAVCRAVSHLHTPFQQHQVCSDAADTSRAKKVSRLWCSKLPNIPSFLRARGMQHLAGIMPHKVASCSESGPALG